MSVKVDERNLPGSQGAVASVTSLPSTPAPTRRRATTAADTPRKSGNDWRITAAVAIVTLGIGAFAGWTLQKQRYLAKGALVSVNGETISQWDFYPTLGRRAGTELMAANIRDLLQLQFAKQKGCIPTDTEVQTRLKSVNRNGALDKLRETGILADDDAYRDARIQVAREKVLTKGITASEAEAKAFYAKQSDPKNPTASYFTPETISIAVILTGTRDQAEAARSDLNRGIPFATVARDRSQDISKQNGGYLPDIQRGRTPSSKVPGLEDTIFGMKVGDTIGPVKFANVWWVIHCNDKKPAQTEPFDRVREDCMKAVLLKKGAETRGKQIDQEFAEFQQKAKVVSFRPEYQTVAEKSIIPAPVSMANAGSKGAKASP